MAFESEGKANPAARQTASESEGKASTAARPTAFESEGRASPATSRLPPNYPPPVRWWIAPRPSGGFPYDGRGRAAASLPQPVARASQFRRRWARRPLLRRQLPETKWRVHDTAAENQVPPSPTREGELTVGEQEGRNYEHPRECIISFGQWAAAFLDVAERAHSNPQALTCPICGSSFIFWTRGLEDFKYAGELEGTVRVLATCQFGSGSE